MGDLGAASRWTITLLIASASMYLSRSLILIPPPPPRLSQITTYTMMTGGEGKKSEESERVMQARFRESGVYHCYSQVTIGHYLMY